MLYVMRLKASDVVYVGTPETLLIYLKDNMESESPADYEFFELGKPVKMKLIQELKVIPTESGK